MPTDHGRAQAWRKRNNWTLDQLSVLTGYSVSAILWMERGVTPAGTPTNEYAWHRYRRVCHSVEIETSQGKQFAFNW